MTRFRRGRSHFPVELRGQAEEICLELEDHSVVRRSAIKFFHTGAARDPAMQAARIAEQFIAQNRALFSHLDVTIDRDYDGQELWLIISSGNLIGAIPLFSPTSARLDLGLVVQPRFPWIGIGPMLAEMGWRVAPIPLRLPSLHRSERRVPPWVLAFMILKRLKGLLDSLDRRFELVRELKLAPRGAVHWPAYAIQSLPSANFLSIPCTFPDLRDDRFLKGAVRYAAEKQLRSLETQKHHGAFVHRFIELAQNLLSRVRDTPPYSPSTSTLAQWLHRPMRTEQFVDGLQAIEWTIEERGLAGLSDLAGVPWTMPMDKFFESWVETIFSRISRRSGGQIKVGRKNETIHPLNWDPPHLGSQKALVPDLWIEWPAVTLVVDAKYKRHWEELQERPWGKLEESLRSEHRADLLQILAYAGLARTKTVVACLVYPCHPEKWKSLADRGKLFHKAEVLIQDRSLRIWLTAVPMNAESEAVAETLFGEVRNVLQGCGAPNQ